MTTESLIELCRLTEEEEAELIGRTTVTFGHRVIAKAQLAKALWGVVDWLDEPTDDLGVSGVSRHYLAVKISRELEAAGLKRPEGKQ